LLRYDVFGIAFYTPNTVSASYIASKQLATDDAADIIPGVVDCFRVKAIHLTEQEK